MYKTPCVHQELYCLLSKFKSVTTSANSLLAPGTDLGQPVPGSTIQWHILGFQGRPGPSSSSSARGRGLLVPMATQMEQPREEKTEEKHQRSSKQGGLTQNRKDSRLCQVLKRHKPAGLGCRKRGLAWDSCD